MSQETPSAATAEQTTADPSGAPVTEATTADTSQSPPSQPDDSERWEKLTRAEQRIRKERSELKKTQAEVQELQAKLASLREAQELLDVDPLGALGKLGVSYEDLTKRFLADPPDPGAKAMTEVERLRAELEERDRKAAEQSQQQALADWRADLKDHLSSAKTDDGAAKYEAIQAAEAYGEVEELIVQHYNATAADAEELGEGEPVLLSFDEAAEIIEEQLVKRFSQFAKLSKLQALLGQQQQTPEPTADDRQPSKRTQAPRTLTNELSSQRSSNQPSRSTPQERRRRAAALLAHKR